MAFGTALADGITYDPDVDALEIAQPDGGVVVQFGGPGLEIDGANDNEDFDENLADLLDEGPLAALAYDLLDGIEADDRSRQQWISDRTRGIDLLGLKLEQPRGATIGAGAPLEGMSVVRHPLLLEACMVFHSNAKRELLPANGPLKVKNNGVQTGPSDQVADNLQDDLNRYLLEFSPEYYPDTDRMLFDTGFSGMTFKKVYNCPLRRRPVSDTVMSKDLIVSNDAVDLRTAMRVTHEIPMSRATMKRMQYVGAYRETSLVLPQNEPENPITQKQGNVQGIATGTTRQQDLQYTVYECYTCLDIPGFEHVDDADRETGLQLPYKVTIEKTSRKILEIRRNWDPTADDVFEARRVFVAYPFAPMFGFYATGLLHILGNCTAAVTAAWRIMIDSGMLANFPGFLYAKSGSRQNDLNFRVPPGGGVPVDTNGMDDIRKSIMALPYKEAGPGLMALTENIVATGRRAGGASEMLDPNGVRQNMPVGTTMAIIEQSAQMLSAVHERMFFAQSQEFQMLLELLRADPDALWRYVQNDGKWTRETLITALENYAFTPVADPNTPTHVHRIMKMTTLKQLQQATPEIYDVRKVDQRIMLAMKIDDPEQLFAPPPPPQQMPPDPAVVIAQATKETKMADIQARAQTSMAQLQQRAQENAMKHRVEIEKLQQKLAEMRLKAQDSGDANETRLAVAEIGAETADKNREAQTHIAHATIAKDIAVADIAHERQVETAGLDRAHALEMAKQKPVNRN